MADNLIQSVFEKKFGVFDYPQQIELKIDPDTTIRLQTWPNPEYVVVVRGYKFEPDELGKTRVSIYIDGQLMLYRIPITEETLEFMFDTPRIFRNQEEIYVKNLDLKRTHKVKITRYYEIHTKEVQEEIYQKIEELVGLK